MTMAEAKQDTGPATAETEALDLGEFSALLEKDFRVREDDSDKLKDLVRNLALAATERSGTATISGNAVKSIKSLIAGIDALLSAQMNEILHAPEVRQIEGTWRGLHYLVNNTETDQKLKIRVMNITKDELADQLEDFEGQMWDQSPTFKKLYTEEYSMFGGAPFGAVIGAYEFSHHPRDVSLLRNISGICASAHAPFIAAAAPQLFRMESWQELPNPQDLQQIVSSPDYASWQSLRESEDSRYIGLTLPRVLARLPYGAATIPVKGFAFEEEIDGKHDHYVWMNAAFPMGVNINRSHKLYSWGTQIRGVETGGSVINLPVHTFPTDDGSVAMKCPTEIAIDDRREAELARLGMMPILHRKNTDIAAFIGAHSLQDDEARAGRLVDPDAQSNERLSANLPYLFPVCRFAHYLKAIARDKIGSFKERADMQVWLSEWINRYVLANTAMADDKQKARRPLAAAEVQVDSVEGRPGYYAARFYLRPHYQLEGINASLRLVSELPSVKGG
ncbi:type VI secretion system contractile sheath large subunit [Rhodobacter sphaeroides]|jgi:type VI secretion protein, EvpB/VC_A0108 family|uniref:Type VI secretion protein, EvpB/VC_A0108 family n=2 Tax=Cereibacter sphaeroides TaxID=1063 RepID=Q3IWK3_CERS4|nr:type VI secretion protein, EvpB/VC_A0108 family [Cereibacter sphaeroides 2.4.1]AMJ49396.1 EvpB family type VI secretion protein [Cereibacter sphaeroides]ANS36104.1 EvpB family type VI secretion protein [Cereibacter sphaeroides]ATN65169.1 EvpB family type VI secretion protein [Cereibacter sphaeroides]AXC63372.1 type VI secretion system contractile sheath large subunit [Cereibacter sphaeroides 2.4.1]